MNTPSHKRKDGSSARITARVVLELQASGVSASGSRLRLVGSLGFGPTRTEDLLEAVELKA